MLLCAKHAFIAVFNNKALLFIVKFHLPENIQTNFVQSKDVSNESNVNKHPQNLITFPKSLSDLKNGSNF